MILGGIDVGTTGCKITVYDTSGDLLCKCYKEYEITRHMGAHEIDGEVIWNSVKEILRDAARKTGHIDAVGVTSFGETFVLLDEADTPLLPSMLYTDPRGAEEVKVFDADAVRRIAGLSPHEMFSLPKVMWVKKHLPDVYAKAKHILLFEDYIVYMLTGVCQIEGSLASRTMGFDVHHMCWSKELFDAAGIDMELFAKPVPQGTVAGKVREPLARELGLTDTLIVTGAHDQVASAVGAGVLEGGYAVDGTGTVECLTPVFESIPTSREIYDDKYTIVPYVGGKYCCYAFSFTGGAAVKWFRDTFAKDVSYKELDKAVTGGPTGVLVLPHFAGAATPYMDNGSKAAFVGVTLETTKETLYKAVMEGVTYELRLNMEKLIAAGIDPQKLYATGGGASSPVWLQMKADILGRPVTALDAPEVGAAGTIMLTGVAVGAWGSLEEARAVMVKEKETYTPNEAVHAAYQPHFERYLKLYDAIRPLV